MGLLNFNVRMIFLCRCGRHHAWEDVVSASGDYVVHSNAEAFARGQGVPIERVIWSEASTAPLGPWPSDKNIREHIQ